MKTFRDLYIHLNGVDLEIFSNELERQAEAPWIRRKDKEEENRCQRTIVSNAGVNSSLALFWSL